MVRSPRFPNQPNAPYEVAPGQIVFDSRSVAVLAVVIARRRLPTRARRAPARPRARADVGAASIDLARG
jgi:hypothetical protein